MNETNRLFVLAILIIVLGVGMVSLSLYGLSRSGGSNTLTDVRDRGYLRCGISGEVSFLSKGRVDVKLNQPIEGDKTQYAKDLDNKYYEIADGFEPDFCRAIAVAVFGKLETDVEIGQRNITRQRVLFLNLVAKEGEPNERFHSLKTGDVDVLIKQTTWTGNRDTDPNYGIDFGPVIFHDGQKLLTSPEYGIENLVDLRGKKVCVAEGTTTAKNLVRLLRQKGFEDEEIDEILVSEFEDGTSFGSSSQFAIREFIGSGGRRCQATTGDESSLLGLMGDVLGVETIESDKEKGLLGSVEFTLVPKDALSYEPLAPVFRNQDPLWGDIVRFSVLSTIWAEEQGYTRDSIDSVAIDALPTVLWRNLGLEADTTRNIIRTLGNYGEIFDRNFAALLDRNSMHRGKNNLRVAVPDGMMFSPPLK